MFFLNRKFLIWLLNEYTDLIFFTDPPFKLNGVRGLIGLIVLSMQINLMHLNDKLCLEHLTKFSLFSLRSNAAPCKIKKFKSIKLKRYMMQILVFLEDLYSGK